MSYFIGSFYNEWVKRKNRLLIVFTVMLIFFAGILITALLNDRYSFIGSSNESGVSGKTISKQTAADELNRLTEAIEAMPTEETQARKRLQTQIDWYAFHIEHNIELDRSTNTHTLIKSMTGVYITFLFPILMIFMGADIFSSELSSGTIKSMLLRPVSRQTIFHAKLAFITISSMMVLFLSYLLNYLLQVRNGWGDWAGDIAIQWGAIYAVPVWLFILIGLLLNTATIIALSAVVVCISYYIRSLALSVVIAMVIMVLVKILLTPFQNSLPFLKYYFMRHVDLVSHLNTTFKGETSMAVSVMVLLCTTLICYGLVWFRIRKEDLPY
ncbi:ABC transporter permease [Candidatus Pristimantibacillus sp. PTI5]|uniref:ABC transporter permease n=1 Tax=Candidatus Pristimantibacillus sp. PTI5 TaxID=3400422 RepID=UPI003B0132F0